MGGTVQQKSAEINNVSLFLHTVIILGISAYLRLHPCNQLQRVEGLRNVIVRPQRKPRDLIHVFRLSRQHNNRKCVFLADDLQKLKTVDIRKHDIQDRQIDLLAPYAAKRILTCIELEHAVLIVLQI